MSLRSRDNDYLFRWNGCDSRDLYHLGSRHSPGFYDFLITENLFSVPSF